VTVESDGAWVHAGTFATYGEARVRRVENLAEKIAAIRERRERYKDMLSELDRTGESQISLTDPDSRAMAAHTHVAVGYCVFR